MAESKTDAARAESQQTVDVDDLDVLQTPERYNALTPLINVNILDRIIL